MWSNLVIFFIISINYKSVICQDVKNITTTSSILMEGEEKLSEYIIKVVDHFKEPNPVGLPGAKIPEPYFVPDMKKYLTFGGSIAFKKTALYGISKFRVEYVIIEASRLEATAAFAIDKIQAQGNYILNTWLKTYSGHYTSEVKGIKTEAIATLGIDRDGKIRVQNISMDVSFTNIEVQFENSGIVALVMQGVFNSLGTFLFDTIKPYILGDAYKKVREEINKKLDEVTGDLQFPNTISPIDMVIINARNKVIALEKDPYKITDYKSSVSIFNIALTQTTLTGISSFYRFGNITLKMENNTAIVDFHISTQEIQGSTHWEVSTFKDFFSRAGNVLFTINYIRVRIILGQSLDTRKRPQFKHLDIELGNIQMRFDGVGTIDYIIELAVNILPNLLRNQIMNAFEETIRWKIQGELNEINVEEIITDFLPLADQLDLKGLKLSQVFPSKSAQRYDDDDFFNF